VPIPVLPVGGGARTVTPLKSCSFGTAQPPQPPPPGPPQAQTAAAGVAPSPVKTNESAAPSPSPTGQPPAAPQPEMVLMASPRSTTRWVPTPANLVYHPTQLIHSFKNISPSPRERCAPKET
jgi:hypothetical protein